MHIYNERKQETIVKIKNTQSAQSAVCSLHGLLFNMTGKRPIESSAENRNTQVTIKFSIIKDSIPFKMVKTKDMTTACDNEL